MRFGSAFVTTKKERVPDSSSFLNTFSTVVPGKLNLYKPSFSVPTDILPPLGSSNAKEA